MAIIKKFIFFPKKLLSNKSAQLGDAGLVRDVSSDSTMDTASKINMSAFLSFFAFALWIIDIAPGLGGVYSGFNFDPQDFWSNWLSKFTFGNAWFVTLLIIVSIIFIFRYVREKTLPNPADIVSSALFTLSMIFLFSNFGWMSYPKAVLHFLFIISFGIYIWRTTNLNTGFLVVFVLLFFDFFLFSTLLKFIPFLKYVSLLGAIVIIWTFAESPSLFTGIMFFGLIVFILIMTIADGAPANGIFFEEAEIQKASIGELGSRLAKGLKEYQLQITSRLESQINYAITGKVEQNQYEPLGVYLEGVKSASSKYYEGEDVTVWGTVKAKTLDDPINIKIGCYVKDGTKKLETKNVDPPNKFSVFTLEEQDFACTFDKNNYLDKLKAGSKTITAFADFNFETLAFLKVYFMDRERLRAMTRENLDPFQEFDIKDKKPIAVYTNGPLEIGIETTTPLVGVSSSYLVYPRLSLSFQNQRGWEGKITGLNELIFLFPKGVELTSPSTDCNMKFEEYDPGKCSAACDKFVKKECNDVCEKHTGEDEGEVQRVIKNCKDLCDDEFKDCQDECGFLFQDEGEKYTAYALKQEPIDEINKKLSIDDDYERFKFFSCKIHPKPKEVLGNTPITTKSFRVKVRYNYRVEKPISIRIVKDPSEDGTTKIGDIGGKGSNYVDELIINTANTNGIDPIVMLAIASVESKFRHCCRDSGQNRDKTCTPTTETYCPADRIIESFTGTSIGIMQINREEWVVKRPAKLEELKKQYGCGEQTVNHLECNIKLGVGILKENTKTCGDLWKAIGMYNTGSCDKGQTYISKVQTAYNEMKTKKTLPQKGFNIIQPPTNLAIFHTIKDDKPAIILKWDKSISTEVDGYSISKSTRGLDRFETQEQITVGNVDTYTDINVEKGLAYTYRIASKSGDYLSAKTEKIYAEVQETIIPT